MIVLVFVGGLGARCAPEGKNHVTSNQLLDRFGPRHSHSFILAMDTDQIRRCERAFHVSQVPTEGILA